LGDQPQGRGAQAWRLRKLPTFITSSDHRFSALKSETNANYSANRGNYYAGNWSLSKFLTLWNQYRSAILQTTPSVAITGPADAGSESTWTIPFGRAVTMSDITLLTQHNYRANGQSPTSTASSLWIIDYFFDCALGGAVGVNFHGGGNGTGYTPIADSGGVVVQARPEYYGILLFTLAGRETCIPRNSQQEGSTPRHTP
jgi:hypothetical protein